MDKKGGELIILCNFSPVKRMNYRIGAPSPGDYIEIFNSDALEFGGVGNLNKEPVKAEPVPMHGLPQSIAITVPPMATIFLERAK